MSPSSPSRDAPEALVVGHGSTVALLPAAAYAVRYTPGAAVLGFAFDAQAGTHAFASDRVRPFRTRPNSVAFTPAGCEVFSSSPRGGEYLVVGLGRDRPASPDEQFTDRIEPRAIAAAHNLRRHLLSRAPTDALEIGREVATFREAVIGTGRSPDRPARDERWMTPRRLSLVGEMIEADLAGRLSVEALAARLGLSSGFLTRAFRAATGTTPYDYVIDRRLARARLLIATTGGSLADVALACGFASQAHLTTQMRRRLGVTPGQLRRRR